MFLKDFFETETSPTFSLFLSEHAYVVWLSRSSSTLHSIFRLRALVVCVSSRVMIYGMMQLILNEQYEVWYKEKLSWIYHGLLSCWYPSKGYDNMSVPDSSCLRNKLQLNQWILTQRGLLIAHHKFRLKSSLLIYYNLHWCSLTVGFWIFTSTLTWINMKIFGSNWLSQAENQLSERREMSAPEITKLVSV